MMRNKLREGIIRRLEILIFDLKLRYKLIIIFSFITLIPILLLGLMSSTMMQSNLSELEEKSLLHNMLQLNNTLDYFLGTYMNASSLLSRNVELQAVLNQDTKDVKDAIQARLIAAKIVDQLLGSLEFDTNSNIQITTSFGKVRFYINNQRLSSYIGDILPLEDLQQEEWFDALYTSVDQYKWQSRVYLFDGYYVVLNRKLANVEEINSTGVARIFVPVVNLKNIIDSNVPPNLYRYYYVDENYRNIIDLEIGSADELLQEIKQQEFTSDINLMKTNGKEYLVAISQSSVTGWKLIFVAPTDVITAKASNVTTVTFITMLMSFALCVWFSYIFSGFITDRIGVLVKKTNQIDKDRFQIQQTIQGHDEIGQLDINFNRMIGRIDHLIENEYKSKLVVNKVKLELLQEQINPHLLYNTLSVISMLSKEDGQHDILQVTNRLIDFYRGILNRGKIITSIRDEVNMALTYIEIMRFVYKLEIDVIVEIDERIYSCFSIKLLLQPVVENAILHGLRQNKGGEIFIGGVEKDGGIEFIVSDNGVGMSEEVRNYLNHLLDYNDLEISYGLANVIKRIDLFWGRSYGVKIEGAAGSGTTVILHIPWLNEDEITQQLESKYLT